jgi:hypothetical protein
MSRSIVITGASKGIGRAARISLQQSHFLPGRELPSSRVRPYSWMEAQAWGVCWNLLPAERILGLHIKTSCPQSLDVRPLNPQIMTTI